MGEVAMKVTGLLPKVASLFNSSTYSDVQFVFVKDDGRIKKIFGHKLILALRSKVFASMFFDVKEPLCEVTVPASQKTAFSRLLKFIYTDDVQFNTFEEAQVLFQLAEEYAVEELAEKCINYMSNETVTIENLLPKYECAIVQNMQALLKDCQNFVCLNTQLVLDSNEFANASVKVVEDIMKLDNLSVSSELEIIGAVLKWGSEELKRRKMSPDEQCLRKCIEPLMKHIRFLALSLSEFDYFIAKFDIFSGYESSVLTRKIYQPNCVVNFPDSLCPISTRRGKKQISKAMPIMPTQQSLFHESTPAVFPSERSSHLLDANNSSQNSTTNIVSSVSHGSTNVSDKLSYKIVNACTSPITSSNKISYDSKKYSPFSLVSQSNSKQAKFFSSPNLVDKKFFQPTCLNNKEFEFPLQESESCLGTSFSKDVKSSLSIKMITGNIRLLGLELKIKNNNSKSPEEFEIDVDFKGFSKKSFSYQFQEVLKGDILTLRFTDKIILQEGSKGVLDVSIDNLFLNRCSLYDITKKCNINIGLNFSCEISLSSTQKLPEMGSNYIFLISKLIYSSY